MRQYRLRSPRLGVGIWTRADLDLALGLWGDPAVARYMGGPFSREQVASRLELEVDRYERHGLQYWPLFLHDSGAHVGCCGVAPRGKAIFSPVLSMTNSLSVSPLKTPRT